MARKEIKFTDLNLEPDQVESFDATDRGVEIWMLNGDSHCFAKLIPSHPESIIFLDADDDSLFIEYDADYRTLNQIQESLVAQNVQQAHTELGFLIREIDAGAETWSVLEQIESIRKTLSGQNDSK